MDLLERDSVLERLSAQLELARQGSGRVVVVHGEAGIGKTSFVKAFCDIHREQVHILWGGCDDLITPQPLGAIWDMTFVEPGLEELLLEDRRQRVFRAMYELLSRSLRPTVMVIEDVHWADESTIDLIRYLGRRVHQTHGLLVLTYNDDTLVRDHPIQLALGDLPQGILEQVLLKPLTETAVSRLAGGSWDPGELWRLTDGNPFLVTELVEAGPESVPVSIRDTVRAKLLRLSTHGRELIETLSVVPGRVNLSLVNEVIGASRNAIEECEAVGILEVDGANLAFRHELTRRAVEAGLLEIRRTELNTAMLSAFEAQGEDVAFCAHFAREASDVDAMVRFLPLAARRAARLGSHREALSHLRALVPFLDRMDQEQLANHYDMWAWEAFLEGGNEMVELCLRAVELRRQLGDPASLGNALLMASEISWQTGKREAAVGWAEEAVSVLEPVGGEELAMAYSTLSRWSMIASDFDATLDLADKALGQLDDQPSPARVVALNNKGSIIATVRYPEGLDDLEESYRLAETQGLPTHQARAASNIGIAALEADRDIQKARHWHAKAMALIDEAEMPGLAVSGLATLAWLDELSGDWTSAERTARRVVENPGIHQVMASWVLARVLSRRGDIRAKSVALEAWERARKANEAPRLGPAGAVVLELAWLGTTIEGSIVDQIITSYGMHMRLDTGGLYGESAFWLSTMGEIDEVPSFALEPFILLDQGEWREAAAYWEERGIPYEKALSLSFGDTEARLEALSILDRLGATPLARKVRSGLRSAGVKGVPRGPSQATRESSLGLTPRQTEVLELLTEDLTNDEIAERLFVSTRTVEHHVSAILAKLGARDRTEAIGKVKDSGAST